MNFMTGNDGKPTIVLPERYGGNRYPAQLTFERKPYRCPVCSGKGLVPNGFYSCTGNTIISTSTAPEQCKSCKGTGVVWSD
mgnify:FL=1